LGREGDMSFALVGFSSPLQVVDDIHDSDTDLSSSSSSLSTVNVILGVVAVVLLLVLVSLITLVIYRIRLR